MEFWRWKIAAVGSVGAKKVILFCELATTFATGSSVGGDFVGSMFSNYYTIKHNQHLKDCPAPS